MDHLTALVGEVLLAFARFLFPHRARARYIVMLGGPGAGKGTMTELLEPVTGLRKLGMGSAVRAYIQTPGGRKWAGRVNSGGLLPARVVLWLLFLELRKPAYNRGAILDGVPRTRWQARWLRLLLACWGHRYQDAVLLDVSEADTIERLALRRTCSNQSCGKTYHLKLNPPAREGLCDTCDSQLVQRTDDRPEAVTERLRQFKATSQSLFEYFRRLGVLRRITSTNEMSVDQVLEDIRFAMEEAD